MKKNVYKIIWADDEIDSMLSKETLKRIKQLDIEVLGTAKSGHELKSLLTQYQKDVDAVIVDFNFNAKINIFRELAKKKQIFFRPQCFFFFFAWSIQNFSYFIKSTINSSNRYIK